MVWLAFVPVVAMGVLCLWIVWMALLGEEWDEWRKRRAGARRERLACPCCRGYPVCWVGQTGNYYPLPELRLCSRHAARWAHIRKLERELWPER